MPETEKGLRERPIKVLKTVGGGPAVGNVLCKDRNNNYLAFTPDEARAFAAELLGAVGS